MNDLSTKSIGRQLQLAARLHRARTAEAIQDLGLFPGQEHVLLALLGETERTVGELATLLFVRPPTISKTLHRLFQQGLVIRKNNELDARKSIVLLTEHGEKQAGELSKRLSEVEKKVLESLDAKDQRRLRKALKKVARSLEEKDIQKAD